MDQETERLVDEVVKARLRWMAAVTQTDQLRDDYRALLARTVETGVRGVKAEIARRTGVSDEAIRLDINPRARDVKAAAQRKTP